MKIAITVWQSDTAGGPSTTAGSVRTGPVAAATRGTPEAMPRAVTCADQAAKDATYPISTRVSGLNAPADIAANVYSIVAPLTACCAHSNRWPAALAATAPARDHATTSPKTTSPARGGMGLPCGQSIAARPSAMNRSAPGRAAADRAAARPAWTSRAAQWPATAMSTSANAVWIQAALPAADPVTLGAGDRAAAPAR